MIRIMRIFLRHGDDDGDDESHLFSGRILIPLFRPPLIFRSYLARSPRPTFHQGNERAGLEIGQPL